MALGTNAIIEIARIAIPEWITSGFSGAAALRAFRALGYGIRTQSFYQLFRQARTQDLLRDVWPLQPADRTLSETVHAITDRRLPAKYQYLFQVNLHDPLDNSFTPYTVPVYSDKRLSLEEAGESALERLRFEADSEGKRGLEIPDDVGVTFHGAFVTNAFARREVGRE